jgi:hypothetical protein
VLRPWTGCCLYHQEGMTGDSVWANVHYYQLFPNRMASDLLINVPRL